MIIISGLLFETFRKKEIDGLIIKRVFNFVEFDPIKYTGVWVFNSRLVNEIKGKVIDISYKKSKLII